MIYFLIYVNFIQVISYCYQSKSLKNWLIGSYIEVTLNTSNTLDQGVKFLASGRHCQLILFFIVFQVPTYRARVASFVGLQYLDAGWDQC